MKLAVLTKIAELSAYISPSSVLASQQKETFVPTSAMKNAVDPDDGTESNVFDQSIDLLRQELDSIDRLKSAFSGQTPMRTIGNASDRGVSSLPIASTKKSKELPNDVSQF